MAQIFNNYSRIVPTWLEAAQHLNRSGRTDSNLILEISDIYTLADFDHQIISSVDGLLKQYTKVSIQTVAGTIFPLGLSKRNANRKDLYDTYKKLLKRGKTVNSWGTYFGRMIERQDTGGTTYNPLELLITRLKTNATSSRFYTASFELGIVIPGIDLEIAENSCDGDIPIFNPQTDGRRWYGGPCLSHLSFKSVKKDGVPILNLTAVYRSHHYCARALGNIIGLSQLLSFVAKSSNMQAGNLTCISTHAELDISAWGGIGNANIILNNQPV